MNAILVVIYLLLFFILTAAIGQYDLSDSFNSTNSRLHRMLLRNYNKDMRPVLHPTDNITVFIQGAPYQIINVTWLDQYLVWDPLLYENATDVFLSSSSIWKPDLVLYYSSDHQKSLLESRLNARVSYTGEVSYFVPFTGEALCPIDVKYFPFDSQNCTLYFGTWTRSNDGVQLKLVHQGEARLNAFYDNQEWQLIHCSLYEDYRFMKATTTEMSGNDTKAVIAFHMRIERQSFYYIFNLVIPSALITLVAVVGFHMPSMSTGGRYTKYRLGMMTLLSMSVLLLSVATEMPKFSIAAVQGNLGSFSGVPLIGIYYFNLLVIISCATVTSSWFVVVEKQVVRSGIVPWYFKWLQTNPNGRCCRKQKRGGYEAADIREVNHLHYSSHRPKDEELELPETAVNPNSRNVVSSNLNGSDNNSNVSKGINELKIQVQEALNTLNAVKVVLKDPLCCFDETGISATLGRLEKISLYFYLFLVFLTIFMFFIHHWWY